MGVAKVNLTDAEVREADYIIGTDIESMTDVGKLLKFEQYFRDGGYDTTADMCKKRLNELGSNKNDLDQRDNQDAQEAVKAQQDFLKWQASYPAQRSSRAPATAVQVAPPVRSTSSASRKQEGPASIFERLKQTADAQQLMQIAQTEKDKGNESYRVKEYDDAMKHYTQSLFLWPTAAAYSNRAAVYIKRMEWDKAMADCADALAMNPEPSLEVKLRLRRATCYLGMKRYQAALEDAEAGLSLDPGSQELHKCRQQAEQGLGTTVTKRIIIEEVSDEDDEDDDGRDQNAAMERDTASTSEQVATTSEAAGASPVIYRTIPVVEMTDTESDDEEGFQGPCNLKASKIELATCAAVHMTKPKDTTTAIGSKMSSRDDSSATQADAHLVLDHNSIPVTPSHSQVASLQTSTAQSLPAAAEVGAETLLSTTAGSDAADSIQALTQHIQELLALATPKASSSEEDDSEGSDQESLPASEIDLEPVVDEAFVSNHLREQAETCKQLGNACFKAEKYSDALKHYQAALKYLPDHEALHNNCAMARVQLKSYLTAVEESTIAIVLNPNYAKAYWKRADAKLALQQPEGALEDLKLCLTLMPGHDQLKKKILALEQNLLKKEMDKRAQQEKQREANTTYYKNAGCSIVEEDDSEDFVRQRDERRVQEIQNNGEMKAKQLKMEAGKVVADCLARMQAERRDQARARKESDIARREIREATRAAKAAAKDARRQQQVTERARRLSEAKRELEQLIAQTAAKKPTEDKQIAPPVQASSSASQVTLDHKPAAAASSAGLQSKTGRSAIARDVHTQPEQASSILQQSRPAEAPKAAGPSSSSRQPLGDADVQTSAVASTSLPQAAAPRSRPPMATQQLFNTLKANGNDLYKQHKYDEALALYDKCLELCPQDSAVIYANKAMVLLTRGDYRLAVEMCSKVLADTASAPTLRLKALHRRATARTKLQQFAAAKDDLEAAMKLVKPGEKPAEQLQHDYAALLEVLRKQAMATPPANGHNAAETGSSGISSSELQTAAAGGLAPAKPASQQHASVIPSQAASSPSSASSSLPSSAPHPPASDAASPSRPLPAQHVASSLPEDSKHPAPLPPHASSQPLHPTAIQHQPGPMLQPDDITKANKFKQDAKRFMEKRDFPQAKTYYNISLTMNPLDASVYSDRALVHMQLGDYKAAIKDAEAAIELEPQQALTSPKLCFRLAMSQHKVGRNAEAYAVMSDMAQRNQLNDPSYVELWRVLCEWKQSTEPKPAAKPPSTSAPTSHTQQRQQQQHPVPSPNSHPSPLPSVPAAAATPAAAIRTPPPHTAPAPAVDSHPKQSRPVSSSSTPSHAPPSSSLHTAPTKTSTSQNASATGSHQNTSATSTATTSTSSALPVGAVNSTHTPAAAAAAAPRMVNGFVIQKIHIEEVDDSDDSGDEQPANLPSKATLQSTQSSQSSQTPPPPQVATSAAPKAAAGSTASATRPAPKPVQAGKQPATTVQAALFKAEAAVNIQRQRSKLEPPRSSIQFDQTCKQLLSSGKIDQLVGYVRTLEPAQYKGLFKSNLTATSIEGITTALEVCVKEDKGFVERSLRALAEVDRLSMLLMLTAGAKPKLNNLLVQLEGMGTHVADLKKKLGV